MLNKNIIWSAELQLLSQYSNKFFNLIVKQKLNLIASRKFEFVQ